MSDIVCTVRPREEADETSTSCRRMALARAAPDEVFLTVGLQERRTRKKGFRSDLGWHMWAKAARKVARVDASL